MQQHMSNLAASNCIPTHCFDFTQASICCRYHHRLFYEYLVYRRPDKLVDLGNGVAWFNIPVMA